MKTNFKRILLSAAVVIVALMAYAERNINLKLNGHNFEGRDTIKVSVDFAGFEDDPVSGDVYVDLIDTYYNKVVDSLKISRGADGRYFGEIILPSNGLDKHEDIFKLANCLSLHGNNLAVCDFTVGLRVNQHIYTENTYNEFKRIPLSEIMCISFNVWENNNAQNDPAQQRGKGVVGVYTKNESGPAKDYKYHNQFLLQVSAELESGGGVVMQEPITIHKLDILTQHNDVTQFNINDNYLINIPRVR